MQRAAGGMLRSLTTPYTCLYFPLFAPDIEPRRSFAPASPSDGSAVPHASVRLDALAPDWPGLDPLLEGVRRAGLVVQRFDHFGNWHEPVAGRQLEGLSRRPARRAARDRPAQARQGRARSEHPHRDPRRHGGAGGRDRRVRERLSPELEGARAVPGLQRRPDAARPHRSACCVSASCGSAGSRSPSSSGSSTMAGRWCSSSRMTRRSSRPPPARS